jgi:spore coat polysaccharide biosynthesis protein SpsF
MNIIAITQARVGSSRLPAKVLKEIDKKPLLQLHLERASQSKMIDGLVVATTTEPDADKIAAIVQKMKLGIYHGSSEDVLDRYYQAAKNFHADYVVRITSDCPLLDAQLMDDVIRFAMDQKVDYVSNTLKPSFPDGQDVEVFRFSALEKAWKEARLQSEREHVTAYIWKNSTWFNRNIFTSINFQGQTDYSNVRLTVDEHQDIETISALIEALGMDAGWEAYAQYYQAHTARMNNGEIKRNEGYHKSISDEK